MKNQLTTIASLPSGAGQAAHLKPEVGRAPVVVPLHDQETAQRLLDELMCIQCDSVTLPPIALGQKITVVNTGTHPITVFPAPGDGDPYILLPQYVDRVCERIREKK